MCLLNDAAVADDDGAFELVNELAHVVRVVVTDETEARVRRELRVHGFRQRTEHLAHQKPEIFAPLGEPRQAAAVPAESRQEIAPKLSVCDQGFEVPMGGRDHASVEGNGPRAAHGNDLALLEHPEQGGLRGERQIADFVEQERALMRGAQESGLVAMGARKRALHVAEQRAFHEVRRECAAVHGDERSRTSRELVDCPGGELLAGAGVPDDEHRELGLRHAAEGRELFGERGDERRERGVRRGALARVVDARRVGARFERGAQQKERVPELDHVAVGERLFP